MKLKLKGDRMKDFQNYTLVLDEKSKIKISLIILLVLKKIGNLGRELAQVMVSIFQTNFLYPL